MSCVCVLICRRASTPLPPPKTDEVDAFLTKRGMSSEHEATLQAKT